MIIPSDPITWSLYGDVRAIQLTKENIEDVARGTGLNYNGPENARPVSRKKGPFLKLSPRVLAFIGDWVLAEGFNNGGFKIRLLAHNQFTTPKGSDLMDITTTPYVRKSFMVNAIQVTEENFEDVALWCRGEIRPVRSSSGEKRCIILEVHNDQRPCLTRAYVGDWIMAKAGGEFLLYTDHTFKNLFETTAMRAQREHLTNADIHARNTLVRLLVRRAMSAQEDALHFAGPSQDELDSITQSITNEIIEQFG